MVQQLPPVEFYFFRHGQSVMNESPHIIVGQSTETPLSALGFEQAIKIGEFMDKVGIVPTEERTFTSTAIRAIDTGRIALHTVGLDFIPVATPEIHEQSFGEFEGRNREEVYTKEVMAEAARVGKAFKLPGGESWDEAGNRVARYIQRVVAEVLSEDQLQDPFVAFGHNASITGLASMINGWSRDETREVLHDMPNGAVSRFVVDNGNISVDFVGKPTQ